MCHQFITLLVAAYKLTELSTLSSVLYGTFLLLPYMLAEDAYTKCSTCGFECLHASKIL